MITAKINVMKIEKARLFKGQDGTYLDITLIPTPNGKYGDYMVVQSISKEERESGKKGIILGNAKIIGAKPAQSSAPPPSGQSSSELGLSDGSDLPF